MSSERVHHLDWLKVLIVYGIVVYHVAMVFAYGAWLVNNDDRSLILTGFAGFCFPWGIPAMFLIAGADAWFGLHSHGVGEFIRKRFFRLIVPLVPGLLILSPIQRFISSHNPPPGLDRLPAYYVSFFRGIRLTWTPEVIGQYWLHLWFLAYLFVISLACAPLLAWLHTARGRLFTAKVADEALHRGLLPFVLPLILAEVVLRPRFPAYQDWADIATYTLVFVWGAMIFSDRRFELVIRKHIGSSLLTGVASGVVLGGTLLLFPAHETAAAIAIAASWAVFIWSWLHVVLYLGIRWLDHPNRVIKYAQESILPVYVIHHPFVLLVASFVVTWNLELWTKFAIIVIAVFALTLLTYEFGVRRWNVARRIFGLDPRREVRQPAPAPAPRAGALPLSPAS